MTAQINEIFFDREKHHMAFCLLFPKDHERIVLRDPGKMAEYGGCFRSTACWRSYQGIWAILEEDRFYLVYLEGKYEIIGDEAIFANWFTGVLRVPRRKLLQYVHMGFGSVCEEELLIEVENGMVVKTTVMNNRVRQHGERKLAWENLPVGENRFHRDGEKGSFWSSILRFFRKSRPKHETGKPLSPFLTSMDATTYP